MAKKLIELKGISKSYGNEKVINNMDLHINENEFLTLLGPSGCGKTTTLRMIGGFEDIDSGELIFDGVCINNVPAHERPINTVFQRYALFPHLNVFDNVAFGLRNFSRILAELKNEISRPYEAKREELQQKLSNKSTSKEDKKEIRYELKVLKKEIDFKTNEAKADLIEKRLTEIEEKYEKIISDLDAKIDIEWEKDDEVKAAKLRIREINEFIALDIEAGSSKAKASKKYETELKKLEKIAVWDELVTLEHKRKDEIKNKALEIKSAKSLMLNKKQIKEEVLKVLKLVKLEGYENRKISTLSGGQQQRVAIARAVVNKPKVLLLDEPLAALDLKLRQNMQYELKEMQKSLGITFIFVTHDQEEALTMSDVIVVMDKGVIQQIGTPEDIYNEPKNRFVANFIGESNIVSGTYLGNKKVEFMNQTFECVDENFTIGEKCDVVIRPEDFDIVALSEAKLIGLVETVIFKGIHFEITVLIGDTKFIIRKYELFHKGDQIGLSVDPYEIHLMKVYE